MFSRVKRIAILSMAAGAVLCAVGCDQSAEADRNLTSALNEANVTRDPSATEFAGAMQKLSEATRDNVAPAIKAQAKAKLALMERQKADDLLRQAQAKDITAAKIALQVLQSASQVQATNLQIDTYKKLDPGEVKAEIQKMINQAKGGAEQAVWMGAGDSAMPTEAAAQQKVSKLEGDIAQRKEQIKSLTEQRTQALEEAERFAKQSEDAKGQESVDAFKKSADSRKKASDLGTQIDLMTAQLAPVEKDLTIAQGQQAAASEAVKQLQDQTRLLDESWQSIQLQVAAQTQLAKEIASDNGPATRPVEGSEDLLQTVAGGSLNLKADAVKQLSDEADKLRDEAREQLESAQSKQAEAFLALSDYLKALGDVESRPELAGNAKNALDLGHSAMSLQQFKLSEGLIAQAIGRLNLSKANSIATRMLVSDAVEPVLAQAHQPVPASLGKKDDFAAKLKESLGLTMESLKSADEKFNGAAGSPKSQVDRIAQATALVQSALVRYDLYRAATLEGNKAAADGHLKEAQEQIKTAVDANAYFPALPAELAEVLPKPPEPSTQPADGAPATQPGEGAATEQSTTATPDATGDVAQINGLLDRFFEALTTDSMDSVNDIIVIDPAGQEDFDFTKKYGSQATRLFKAIETKFDAEQATAVRNAFKAGAEAGMTANMKIENDIAIDSEGDPCAKKVDGQWKLYFGESKKPADQRKAEQEKQLAAIDSLAGKIESGEISTKEQLGQALMTLSGEGSGEAKPPTDQPAAPGGPTPGKEGMPEAPPANPQGGTNAAGGNG